MIHFSNTAKKVQAIPHSPSNTFTGLVNGIDVDMKYEDTFLITNPCNILAKKIFEMTVTVIGNLSVSGLVDGVDIDQEAVTLHTDQVVIGRKKFLDGMTIIGHVFITEGKIILLFYVFFSLQFLNLMLGNVHSIGIFCM